MRARTQGRPTVYRVSDRMHDGRVADVAGSQIAPTVSAWLAELGVSSPLVRDLASAVRAGDWPAAHELGEYLAVDVTVAD